MKRFLNSHFGRKPLRTRPVFEALEDRTLLAAALTASLNVADGVLRVEGTYGADQVNVHHEGRRVRVEGISISVIDGTTTTTAASVARDQVTLVEVAALDGDDVVRMHDTLRIGWGLALLVNGGRGHDSIQTGQGADTVYGAAGHDTIRGGANRDTLFGGHNPAAVEVDRDYGLFVERGNDNYFGLNEKWVAPKYVYGEPNPWYYITPDGKLYQVTGEREQSADDVVVETFDPSYYADLTKLETERGLYDLNLYYNWGLRDEKWFAGNGDRYENRFYFITSAGEVYHWDGLAEGGPDPSTGTFLTALDSSYYVDPHELADASAGGPDNDVIDGQGGNDTVLGGDGSDSLYGGDGHDQLIGQNDNDFLRGDGGNDELIGCFFGWAGETGNANDTIEGGDGSDSLYGGDGEDRLNGENGNDFLRGDGGNDGLTGGNGDDTLLGEEGHDVLDGGLPGLTPEVGAKYDVLDGGAGDDLMWGGEGLDTLTGGSGADTLLGEEGHDVLDGGLPGFTPEGGSTWDLLDGGAGDDLMWGGEGPDTLIGGHGSDTLNGEGANDTLDGGLPGTTAEVGADADLLDGGDGDDLMWGGEGPDTLRGGHGTDTVLGEAGPDVLDGGLLGTTPEVGSDWDLLDGGFGNDFIWGGEGFDTLRGGEGDDTLVGESGRDTMEGGGGFDDLRADRGDEQLSAGEIVNIAMSAEPHPGTNVCGPSAASRFLLSYQHWTATFPEVHRRTSAITAGDPFSLISRLELGTIPTNLWSVLTQWRPETQMLRAAPANLDLILQLFGSGRPVIALINSAGTLGANGRIRDNGYLFPLTMGVVPKTLHYVVLTGFNLATRQFTFIDDDGARTYSFTKFMARWDFRTRGVWGDFLTGALGCKERTIFW